MNCITVIFQSTLFGDLYKGVTHVGPKREPSGTPNSNWQFGNLQPAIKMCWILSLLIYYNKCNTNAGMDHGSYLYLPPPFQL